MMITTTAGGTRFLTLGDDWRRLFAWEATVGALPADGAAFAARYGAFADPGAVAAFVAAVGQAQALAARVGGPAALKRALLADPGLLTGLEPPAALWARLAWLAGAAANTADTLAETLDGVPALLAPSRGSKEERAGSLRAVLCGGGGLSQDAAAAGDQVQEVRDGIPPLTEALGGAARALGATPLPDEANRRIGELRAALPRLEEEAAEAYRKWTGKPLPPGGAPPAAEEGGGGWRLFGGSKERWKAEYERLEEEIGEDRADLAAKERFAGDLGGFFVDNERVVPAVLEADGQLRRVQALFADTASELIQLCSISSVDQLSDAGWVERALDLPATVEKWRELAASARGFLEHALVEDRSAV